MKIGEEQMTKLGALLVAEGWPVEVTKSEWEDGDDFTVDWGGWWVSDEGMLHTGDDHWPVNDCDLVAFIAAVHRHWHAVGGAVISEVGQ